MVVIDSNVYISCLLGSESAEQVVKQSYGLFDIAVSQQILDEICTYIDVNWLKARGLKKLIRHVLSEKSAVFMDIQTTKTHAVRDPKDYHVVELAVLSKSKLIISGDKDLLEFKSAHIKVISPSEFLNYFKSSL